MEHEPTTPAPDAANITLRPVQKDDDAFLFKVYASTRKSELAHLGWSDFQRDVFLRMQFDAQRRDYESRFPGSDHHIILAGGRPVGRIWVMRGEDEIRLIDVALLTKHRGAGTGTRLIRELMDEAARAGKPFRLSVVKSNHAAIRLYERLGLKFVADHDTHLLMERLPDA